MIRLPWSSITIVVIVIIIVIDPGGWLGVEYPSNTIFVDELRL